MRALLCIASAWALAAQASEPRLEQTAQGFFSAHRPVYLLSAAATGAGLLLGLVAQGEAHRVETEPTARGAAAAFESARAWSGTSNLLYGFAGASLLCALVFEIVPRFFPQTLVLHF